MVNLVVRAINGVRDIWAGAPLELFLDLGNLYSRGKDILRDVLRLSKSVGSDRVMVLGRKIHQKFSRYQVS